MLNNTFIKTSNRRRLKQYRFHWLLPLLFIIGYIATFSIFEDFALEYYALTSLSFFASCLLLSRLNRPLQITAPVWLLLLLFIVAYYFKFYLIVYWPKIVKTVWFQHLHWIADSPSTLLDGYATTTYAFITFCLTAWLLLLRERRLQTFIPKRKINYRFVTSILVWAIPLLMGVTAYLMYITKIAVMGKEPVYLLFRLAGLIFYTRTTLIPALLLLLIWYSDRVGSRRHFIFGIILLFIHGISDMILRSSKGSLLAFTILLLILFLLTNRLNKRHVIFGFIIIILLTILLFPIISAYRFARLEDPTLSVSYAFSKVISTLLDGEMPLPELLDNGLTMFIFRLTGVESLLPIVGTITQPLGIANFFDPYVERVFTIEVLGFSPHAIQGCATSLLGWFYLVGGNYLVVIGVFGFVLLTWLFWRALTKLKLLSLPVAQAMYLIFVFQFSVEGVIDRIGLGFLTTLGPIAVCELIVRNGGKPHWLKKPSLVAVQKSSF